MIAMVAVITRLSTMKVLSKSTEGMYTMVHYEEILTKYVSEQIALEEHLCSLITEQIAEIDGDDFVEVRELLEEMGEILERHYKPLNDILNQLENDESARLAMGRDGKMRVLHKVKNEREQSPHISKMLREDYSALNLITMSNTLLHTAALLVDKPDIATLALQHLRNLTPLVARISDLVPEIVARELHNSSPKIDCSLVKTAIANVKLAWRSLD